MRIIAFLVHVPTRNEKIKWRFKGLLGIVKDRVKPIPARRPQSTRGVDEARKGHRNHLGGGVLKGHMVHEVRGGIVELVIALNTTAESPDPL